jgi:hypothetical protein
MPASWNSEMNGTMDAVAMSTRSPSTLVCLFLSAQLSCCVFGGVSVLVYHVFSAQRANKQRMCRWSWSSCNHIVCLFSEPQYGVWMLYVRCATLHICSYQFPAIANNRSRDRSVGVEMSYGLGRPRSVPGRGKIFFSSPKRPDSLWAPPSLLTNGYWGLFFRG